jgi:tripartite-type tricarboxylate transporter receptor subunit TctC
MKPESRPVKYFQKLAFSALLLCAGTIHAQDYPNKSIRFLVGPGPDIMARLVADKLRESWGKPVIVDQIPAAGGMVAYNTLAKAAPDGHTIMLSSGAFTINGIIQKNLPYDYQRDFAPVSLIATIPFVLMVNPSVPANSLKELVELIRARPGKYNYASSGNGTPPHLAGEMLKQMAKIDMVHVPYKGVAPAVTDLIGGNVDLMFVVAPSALSWAKSGKLRPLAVSSLTRYANLPDVPTVAEQGYPEFAVVGWNGLHMPAKTPPAIVEKMSREVAKILHMPEVRERAAAAGFEPVGSTTREFDEFVKADIERTAKVIKAGNIRAE